jgi:hypothetical protein
MQTYDVRQGTRQMHMSEQRNVGVGKILNVFLESYF